jgi:hypothetical protein
MQIISDRDQVHHLCPIPGLITPLDWNSLEQFHLFDSAFWPVLNCPHNPKRQWR